jgi:hypothetical protein
VTNQKNYTSVVRLGNTTEDATIVISSQTEIFVDVRCSEGEEFGFSRLNRCRQIQLLLLNVLRNIDTA